MYKLIYIIIKDADPQKHTDSSEGRKEDKPAFFSYKFTQ